MAKLGASKTRSSELPAIGGRASGGKALPKVPPAPAFYLAWHPMRWHVMRGLVVPRLQKVSFTNGANGVSLDRDGRPLPQLAVLQIQEAGWTIIPWDVDGDDAPAYLYRAENGGWISRWERLFPGSTVTAVDEDGYAEWCARLVTHGPIPEPEDFLLAKLVDDLRSELHQYRKDNQNSPRIEKINADIVAVEAARELLLSTLEPIEPADDDLPSIGAPEPEMPPEEVEQPAPKPKTSKRS